MRVDSSALSFKGGPVNVAQRTMYGIDRGRDASWLRRDVVERGLVLLRRGLSFAEVASFLRRSEDEVREKAKEYD
jgi:hypothetical protein